MKHLLSILAALCVLAAPAAAQTIRTLGYNTTNGQVVAATNVVWTNSFSFSSNTIAAQVRTNLGLGATWLTNTNVTNFRTAVGLGATNDVTFNVINAGSRIWLADQGLIEGDGDLYIQAGAVIFNSPIDFIDAATTSATRANLGIPLPALTNTSNVTAMRALSGSTNTNTPYSGSVSLTNTNTLVFSNGILQSIQ